MTFTNSIDTAHAINLAAKAASVSNATTADQAKPIADQLLLSAPTWSSGSGTSAYSVASGDVTDKSAVIWSRAENSGTMNVQVSNDSTFSRALQKKTVMVNASTDFAGTVMFDKLPPYTTYYYKVWFTPNNNPTGNTSTNSTTMASNPISFDTFKTAPSPSDSKPFSFVVGGDLGGQQFCRRIGTTMNYPIFSVMKAASPDFFIFNGDQIYADNYCPASGPVNVTGWTNIQGNFPKVNDPSIDWKNYTQVHDVYFKHWDYNRADPNLQSLLRNVPIYSQADDHDVANNYAPSSYYYSNITKDRAGFPNSVKAGIQEFFNFSPIDKNASDPTRIYRSFHWGRDADLFIVDQHQYRSRNDLPDIPANNKTLLGKAQLHWLEQGLLNSNAIWKIVSLDDPITIPSCVYKETPTDPLGCDNFASDGKSNMTFTRERNEFLRFLDEHKVKNVIFVVTDVHFAANILVNHDFNGDGKNFTYYELVSGPLSAFPAQPSHLDPTVNTIYLYKEGPLFNFGYYKIEHEGKEEGRPHLISEIIDINGLVRPGSRLDLTPQ